MQTRRSRPLVRVGRTFFGAALGATIDVVAATVIGTSNGTPEGWALAMAVLFGGAPIAMLLGAVTGALWPPTARATVARATARNQTRRLRDAHLAAWVIGILGGLAAFAALFIVTAVLVFLLAGFIGALFPIGTSIFALLALVPVLWTSVGAGVRVIRSVDARIRPRELGPA